MPKRIARPRSRRTNIGVAVVAVDSPRMQNALVVDKFVSGTANVVHNLVLATFLQCAPNASAQIVKHFVPGHALPLAFTALARAAQWIEDALRIVDLIDGGRTFGAVASTAAGMRRIALKLLHAHLLFIDICQQPTRRFAVEADRGNQRIMSLNSARPLRRIVFAPVIPFIGRRKAGESL